MNRSLTLSLLFLLTSCARFSIVINDDDDDDDDDVIGACDDDDDDDVDVVVVVVVFVVDDDDDDEQYVLQLFLVFIFISENDNIKSNCDIIIIK